MAEMHVEMDEDSNGGHEQYMKRQTNEMEEGEVGNVENSQNTMFSSSGSTQYTLGRSNSFTEEMVYNEAPRLMPFGNGNGGLSSSNQGNYLGTSTPFMTPGSPPRRDYSEDIKSANTPTIQGRFEMDFEVTYTIGNGTFGTVYAAKHRMSHMNYAVKRSRRAFTSNVDRNNMLKEVEYMAEAQEGGTANEGGSSAAAADGDNHIVRIMFYVLPFVSCLRSLSLSLSIY